MQWDYLEVQPTFTFRTEPIFDKFSLDIIIEIMDLIFSGKEFHVCGLELLGFFHDNLIYVDCLQKYHSFYGYYVKFRFRLFKVLEISKWKGIQSFMQWDYLEANLIFTFRSEPIFDNIFKYNYRSGGFNIFWERFPCLWSRVLRLLSSQFDTFHFDFVKKYHAFREYYTERNYIRLSWNFGLDCLKF